MTGTKIIDEPRAAVVLTLESTRISACSCGSLVSKGMFNGKSLFIVVTVHINLSSKGKYGNINQLTLVICIDCENQNFF